MFFISGLYIFVSLVSMKHTIQRLRFTTFFNPSSLGRYKYSYQRKLHIYVSINIHGARYRRSRKIIRKSEVSGPGIFHAVEPGMQHTGIADYRTQASAAAAMTRQIRRRYLSGRWSSTFARFPSS